MKIDKNKKIICIIGLSLIIYTSLEITSCYSNMQNNEEITYNEDISSEINLSNEENYKLFNKIKAMK